MATPHKPRIEPTPEQLQAVWLLVRNRRWPATLQAALQHPLYSRLLHMGVVMQQLRQQRRAQANARAQTTTPPAAAAWPARRPATTAVDMKRRAAGETDDD